MRHLLSATVLAMTIAVAVAQGPPPMRKHTANEARPIQLVPATEKLPARNEETIHARGEIRVIESNGIPKHLVGEFPNRGNPHEIKEQPYRFEIPANPKAHQEITPAHLGDGSQPGPPNRPFGVALNGVLFDPGTAEFWKGDRELDWNYEALGGAVGLGLDENHAHVQPNGAYHYHGLPTPYLRQLGVDKKSHSPQVGWAADGFPIYALYGYQDPKDPMSPIIKLTSSYQLKDGQRPSGNNGPGGEYDGAFTRDYEFITGNGTLDECNGRYCVTPEFPDGTYAYFLTTEWPVIPRNFRGTPVELRGPGGPPSGEPGRPGAEGRPPRGGDKGKGKGKGKGDRRGPPPR
jgi:hypothetical protein